VTFFPSNNHKNKKCDVLGMKRHSKSNKKEKKMAVFKLKNRIKTHFL
jgi:hypothetical protein